MATGIIVGVWERRFVALLVWLLLVAGVVPAGANQRYDLWQSKHPLVQTAWIWGPISLSSQADLDYFSGSGLNTYWDGVRSGSSGWQHTNSKGIPTFVMSFQSDKPDLQGFINDFNKARAAHKNIIGVALGDEVKSTFAPGGLAHMGGVRDWITNNQDPSISGLITFTSVPGGQDVSHNKTYQDYWNETCDTIRPDAIFAQMYPVGGGSVTPYYYSSLEWFSSWAKKKDVAMCCWLDTWSTSEQSIPSESELRLQRFTSLAYGMRGFGDFLWNADGNGPSVKGAGYWDGSGKPTRIYKDLAIINREIANIGKSFTQLTHVCTYHMDSRDDGDGVRHWSDSDSDLPTWMCRTWKLVNVTGSSNRNHLMVGVFRDAAGEEYFMVVNKDFAKDKSSRELATKVTLSFDPSVKSIKRLRRTDGKLEHIQVNGDYAFLLGGGNGDLFKYDTGTPFAGLEQPIMPRLISAEPGNGGSLCGASGNSIVLNFDRNASQVIAEIRRIGEDGKATGEDMAQYFIRTTASNNKTIIYQENGNNLLDKTKYRITLHWASARSIDVVTIRGDVDGDGQVLDADMGVLTQEIGSTQSSRADLDGDGIVQESDRNILERILHPRRFQWTESFEDYPEGPLTGNGPWVEAASLPGSQLSKAWVKESLQVQTTGDPLDGNKKAGGKHYGGEDSDGNEAIFDKEGGFGGTGILRCGYLARCGNVGYKNASLSVWNSKDKDKILGGVIIEFEGGNVFIHGGGTLTIKNLPQENSKATITPQGGRGLQSKGLDIECVINFGASRITWQCRDLDYDKLYGPYEVEYTGTLIGLDAIGIFHGGENSQIDRVVIQNY